MHSKRREKTNKSKKKKTPEKLTDSTLGAILLIVVVVIVVTVILGAVCFYCYKNGYIPTVITVGEMLGFYGALLTFVGTVYLGCLAYTQNKKANATSDKLAVLTKQAHGLSKTLNDTNIKSNVKPYLLVKRLNQKFVMGEKSTVGDDEKKLIKNDDCQISNLIFNIKDNEIEFFYYLNDEEYDRIAVAVYGAANKIGIRTTTDQFLYFHAKVINAGNGAATNFVVTVYKKDNPDLLKRNEVVCLNKNDEIDLFIFAKSQNEIIGEYILKFEYFDILGNKYTQIYPFIFIDESSNDKPDIKMRINLVVNQQEETKNDKPNP